MKSVPDAKISCAFAYLKDTKGQEILRYMPVKLYLFNALIFPDLHKIRDTIY